MINFDNLKLLHDKARIKGVNSKEWINFVSTMFDCFPELYETAKAMSEQQNKLIIELSKQNNSYSTE